MGILESRLVASIRSDRPESVEALVRLGADPGADLGGVSPLGVAALEGRGECLKALLAAGADPGARPGVAPPLHLAAARGDAAICEALLAAGASLSSRDARGMTPLHWAGPEAAQALLAAGADLSALDASGRSPQQTAPRASRARIGEALLQREASSSASPAKPKDLGK